MTSRNNNGGVIDQSSLAAERQNAITVTESSRDWIARRCNISPVFCIGHIRDAFDGAFGLSLIKKRRPLLIYIHHDNGMLNLFSSDILNEFLRENYIVWSWNITNESNRQLLIKIWEENFSEQSFIHFLMDECPVLIGVMRQIPMENSSSSSLEYKSNILLESDILVRTNEQLDLESLLYELIVFKEEFDKNEQYLSFHFVQRTGLCWEIALQTAQYLPLNDAVTVFSYRILGLLGAEKKLPIVRPSDEFMKRTIHAIKPERIVALRLEANQFNSTMSLARSNTFTHVQSLTLENLPKKIDSYEMKRYFPRPTDFFLRYDEEIDFHSISKIFNLIPYSIKRFRIHGDSIPCSHYRPDLVFARIIDFNTTIEFLVVNVDHTHTSLINTCVQRHYKCILRTLTDFIKIMSNIRYVCIIINSGNVETLLDKDEWTGLAKSCKKLEKITLKVMRNKSQGTQLGQKIQEIQNVLHIIRQSIQFEVKTK